jgi:phenylalanine-4-hydroxylase
MSRGLTAGAASEIEDSRAHGQLFITQPYDHYSEENHEAWRRLYARMLPKWERYANPHFLQGIRALSIDPERIPRLEDVNRFLHPLTGFRAKAVSGYVPAFTFFDCLRKREFPTTVTIRRSDQLDYLPEPDIFHDIAGHVPMHTDHHFAETLVRFGECARMAASVDAPVEQLTSIIRAMARFFWFTIEFGLMRAGSALKVYGSGLLSSYSEIEHAIDAGEVQRHPLQLEWVINQGFAIDHYQPLLFIVDSFEHLYGLVEELGQWMLEGRLDNVAPGEPAVRKQDVRSFRPK